MDNMYIVVANGTRTMSNGWTREFQIPTFFVQASSGKEAETKALEILNSAGKQDLRFYIDISTSESKR